MSDNNFLKKTREYMEVLDSNNNSDYYKNLSKDVNMISVINNKQMLSKLENSFFKVDNTNLSEKKKIYYVVSMLYKSVRTRNDEDIFKDFNSILKYVTSDDYDTDYAKEIIADFCYKYDYNNYFLTSIPKIVENQYEKNIVNGGAKIK